MQLTRKKGVDLQLTRKQGKGKNSQLMYHLMMLPGMLFLLVFSFVPMLGIVMAFQNYIPAKGILGSTWVGLANFKYMLEIPDSLQILMNTVIIASWKIVLGTIVPVVFALLLNEIRIKWAKRTIQTIVYLPNFLSWVVLAAVVVNLFDYHGPVNTFLATFGVKPILFMGSNHWFRQIIIGSDVWKGFGYGSIIYLAALTGIDPGLYEAAEIDGASRWQQLLHVTLPGMLPIIMMMTALNLTNILNAGFDQIFNLYNPIVYETGDIIDTYVYRVGLLGQQYSLGTAIGLLKSVVGATLMISANQASKKFANMQIF
ncbi:sugar ABC transporter permease [Schleiferilactobacillus harbinensis]|jgi:putative aldouronate transport system permease protein|uniref:ABC transporter permease subunit n=3 Tax=Schleiferilactobacillus harbinensis TaxID=304207 RepID=A0ABU7T1Z5_9LACO|nr:ABC transporter permease subunit [Schleiferilactobacillus harbinensis]KRM23452.1 beta-xyloside abc transporter permease component [Schleiferilactobacillus harbinensis DSM 16991]MBO3090534.1 sugar ABC transporter permease [Schleiferilactobacillus harbinensis]MCI1687497.1 ABC transporter permease subunit [Schleiferilactobacillus harbinensis]MCI1784273.1 ABC transporter permease subunit [Schleiferilactobacillus harbinensis]MCI1850426.1 ABC transporter permease subunit [Schleiferilactobacillus 